MLVSDVSILGSWGTGAPMTTGPASRAGEETKQLTAGRRKHAHQRCQLGWTSAMGNMQSSASRARNAALRRWILLVVHDGRARRVRLNGSFGVCNPNDCGGFGIK